MHRVSLYTGLGQVHVKRSSGTQSKAIQGLCLGIPGVRQQQLYLGNRTSHPPQGTSRKQPTAHLLTIQTSSACSLFLTSWRRSLEVPSIFFSLTEAQEEFLWGNKCPSNMKINTPNSQFRVPFHLYCVTVFGLETNRRWGRPAGLVLAFPA